MNHILSSFISVVLAFVAGVSIANAQALDGTYTVTQGSTVTVQIGATYQTTLKRATNINYTWTAANSSIAIQSKTSTTCTIKGVTPTGSVRLNYQCSYLYDGYSRTMNFYYDITVKSNVIEVTRVEISPDKATMDVGETLQLTAMAYPTNATNRNLNWTTENYSVASVDNSGLVTARGAGKVWIWARAKDGSGAGNYCVITVNEPTKVESIKLAHSELNLRVGESSSIDATVLPEEAYNKTVKWETSDSEVATVAEGRVTAVGIGECDVVCSSTDGSNISATCHVVVQEEPRYWLTVKAPNGAYSFDVTGLEEINIKMTPDDGYKINSVTLNEEDITNQVQESTLTLDKIEENSTLNVVFVKDGEISAIAGITSPDENIRVAVCNRSVVVTGLGENNLIDVYSSNGVLIKSTKETSFDLNESGVYVLRIGSRSFKVVL